jgi:hypothetical protein
MKPSSDIDLFTTTLPVPVLVFRTLLLQKTFAGRHPGLRVMTLPAPESQRRSAGADPTVPSGALQAVPHSVAKHLCGGRPRPSGGAPYDLMTFLLRR